MANVEIGEEKYELLKLRAEEKGFDSTEEYIDHLLDQIAEKIKKEEQEREYSEEQEEEMKEKLKQLGYMD